MKPDRRKYDPAQRAGLRHRRLVQTRANGGVAPAPVHNYVTYCTWRCRCPRCVADYNAKKCRRRQEAHRTRLRRPEITVESVSALYDQGMIVSEIMRLLDCSRDLVNTRLLRAVATGRR